MVDASDRSGRQQNGTYLNGGSGVVKELARSLKPVSARYNDSLTNVVQVARGVVGAQSAVDRDG